MRIEVAADGLLKPEDNMIEIGHTGSRSGLSGIS